MSGRDGMRKGAKWNQVRNNEVFETKKKKEKQKTGRVKREEK